MAPIKKVHSECSDENPCKSCLRATKSNIRCIKCKSSYHAACAVRIRGIRVTGYNELQCPECVEASEALGGEDAAPGTKQLIESNRVLNTVVLRLMEDRDVLKSEIIKLSGKIHEITLHFQCEDVSRHKKANKPRNPNASAPSTVDHQHERMTEAGCHTPENLTSVDSRLTVEAFPGVDADNTALANRRLTDATSSDVDINDTALENVNNLARLQRKKMAEVINLAKDERTEAMNRGRQRAPESRTGTGIVAGTEGGSSQLLRGPRDRTGGPEVGAYKWTSKPHDGFKEVRKRKQRKRIGTAAPTECVVAEGVAFLGVEKKAWLYINRVQRHVTEDIILAYIKNSPSFQNTTVGVRELPTVAHQNKCFAVCAPFHKKDELYDVNFWPRGVGVKRLDFGRYRDAEQLRSL